MLIFPRRIKPIPASCRAYSSYFSSKAGGRYFNSSRPPKSVVTSTPNKGKPEASQDADGSSGTANANGNNGSSDDHPIIKQADQSRSSGPPSAVPTHNATSSSIHELFHPLPYHPSVDSKDFKLHQFFSLHRPLLLLSQPTSIIFEQLPPIPPTNPLSSSPTTSPNIPPPPAHLGTVDDPPESSPEADADAARQLARALVMTRAGGRIMWEATLKRLGIDVDSEEERVCLKAQWKRELEEVMLDSTKRKRRRKMKKHK